MNDVYIFVEEEFNYSIEIMITREFAEEFARHWINAWNAHDLEQVLIHYAGDFEIETPMALKLLPESMGILKGKNNIRKEALARKKAEGIKLGRPVGSKKKKPLLAKHADFIKDQIAAGAKQIEIARKLKVHRHTVKEWIKAKIYEI